MKKKILNISLIASLLIQPAVINADVMATAMSNVTGPARTSITDSSGRQIGNKMYTGGFSYRFNSTTPPPIFNASPPSIEASCSGLNLKGMFASLLNLDQLGAMLQDAGASLAWGVAIGLIYSLPGVASAFKMINEWATKIQQLLASACQMGQNIGMNIASKYGPDMNALGKTVVSAIETPAKALQDGVMGMASAIGSEIPSGVKSLFNSPETLSSGKKADAMGSLLGKAFTSDVSLGGSIMSGYLKHSPTMIQDLSQSINEFKIINIAISDESAPIKEPCVSSDSINCIQMNLHDFKTNSMSLTAGQKIEQAFFAYAILTNYVGDVGFEETSIASFIESFAAMSKMANKTETPAENAKATNTVVKTEDIAGFKMGYTGEIGKAPGDTATSLLASILLYGVDPKYNEAFQNETKVQFLTSFKAPIISLAILKEKDSAKKSVQPFVYGVKGETQFFGPNANYKGTYNSSECIVKSLIKNPNSNPIEESGQSCTSLPIVINNIHWYIKIITNTPEEHREFLIDSIVKYNAYYATLSMLDGILSTVNISANGSEKIVPNNTGATPSSVTSQGKDEAIGATLMTASKKAQNEFLTKLKEAVNHKLASKEKPSEEKLKELFITQDKINRERAIKTSSKQ